MAGPEPTPAAMQTRRPAPWPGLRRAALAVAGFGLLAGCYAPAPSAHAVLLVAPNGDLSFDGRPVTPPGLQAAIEGARVPHKELVVEIHASPQAPMARVEQAVAAVKASHAHVAFAAAEP